MESQASQPKRPNYIPIPSKSSSVFENIVPVPVISTELVEVTCLVEKLKNGLNGEKKPFKDEMVSEEGAWQIIDFFTSRTCFTSTVFKDVPTFSAMTGLNLVLTGPIRHEARIKDKLLKQITDMNGSLSVTYKASCTHIVSTYGITEKVIIARSKGVPVMRLEWVDAVWKACHGNPFIHATHDIFKSYECPMFHNVGFKISEQIPNEVANHVVTKVKRHGGKILDKFVSNFNVLIARSSEDPLYFIAKDMGIRVISPAWIFVCDMEKSLQTINFYEIRPKPVDDSSCTNTNADNCEAPETDNNTMKKVSS